MVHEKRWRVSLHIEAIRREMEPKALRSVCWSPWDGSLDTATFRDALCDPALRDGLSRPSASNIRQRNVFTDYRQSRGYNYMWARLRSGAALPILPTAAKY